MCNRLRLYQPRALAVLRLPSRLRLHVRPRACLSLILQVYRPPPPITSYRIRIVLISYIDPAQPIPTFSTTQSVPGSDSDGDSCSAVTVTVTSSLSQPGVPTTSLSQPGISTASFSQPGVPTASLSQPGVSTVPLSASSVVPPFPRVSSRPAGGFPTGSGVTSSVVRPSSTLPAGFTGAAVAANVPASFAGALGLIAFLF
jgi:hypothetical protein